MSESIAEFMARRRREVEGIGRQAVEAAYDAYAKANKAGRDLALRTQSQVMQYGARLVEAAARPPAPRPATRRPASAIETPAARKAGGDAARLAGSAVGVVKGAVHTAEGLVDGARFAHRIANPIYDAMTHPGETAPAQIAKTAAKVVNYAARGLADPAGVAMDAAGKAVEFRRKVDPSATPAASTFSGELRRNFDIGQNQGEVAFDVGSLIVGGPGAKATRHMVPMKAPTRVEDYLAQGFSRRAADRLAELYEGMGHHFAGRRLKLPEVFSESEFNVLKPPGMTRGDFYKLHYEVDPYFHGTGLPGRESWSGKRLGLKKHDRLGRIWHGSPAPLKARVIGLTAGAGAVTHDLSHDQEDAR